MDDGDPARCPNATKSNRPYKTHLFSALAETGVSFCVFGGCCVGSPLFEGGKLLFPPRLFVLIH